jgi:ketosteroid isomerase-like protein
MRGAAIKRFVPSGRGLAFAGSLVSLLVLAVCAGLLHAEQPKIQHKHENRRVIDQLEEAWRTAVLKSDSTAMNALLADDYMAITANGTLQTRDQALDNIASGRVHIASLEVSDRKVRFYGTTALVTSLAEVQGTNPLGEFSGSFRYTRVYVRDAQGRWKIVSFEASRIRPPGERR